MGWELSDDKIEELQLHIHKPNLIYPKYAINYEYYE